MRSTTLVGAGLVDGTGADPLDDVTIQIDGDRIGSVTEGGAPAGSDPATLVDLRGKSVRPGLIDMHVRTAHPIADSTVWGGRIGRRLTPAELATWSVVAAQAALRAGLTTLRDVGCEPDSVFALRDLIHWRSHTLGPRIRALGNLLCVPSVGTPINCSVTSATGWTWAPKRLSSSSGSSVAPITSNFAPPKVPPPRTTWWASTSSAPPRWRPSSTSRTAGLRKRMAAHTHATSGVKTALRAGANTFEHGVGLDTGALGAEAGTYLAFANIGPSRGLESHAAQRGAPAADMHQKSLRKVHRCGVRIAFGTHAAGPYNLIGGRGAHRSEIDSVQVGKVAGFTYDGGPTNLLLLEEPAMVYRSGRPCVHNGARLLDLDAKTAPC